MFKSPDFVTSRIKLLKRKIRKSLKPFIVEHSGMSEDLRDIPGCCHRTITFSHLQASEIKTLLHLKFKKMH